MRVSIAKWTKQSPIRYTAFDGRLYLERRPNISPHWHARLSIQNRLIQKTTRTPDLPDAKDTAEKWFLNLRQRVEQGIPVAGRSFATATMAFLTHHEHTLLPIGASNERKIRNYRNGWNVIREFIEEKMLTEIDVDVLEALCLWRKTTRHVSDKTLRADIGLVRLVLKFAQRQRWIDHLPLFPQLTSKPVSPERRTFDARKSLLYVRFVEDCSLIPILKTFRGLSRRITGGEQRSEPSVLDAFAFLA